MHCSTRWLSLICAVRCLRDGFMRKGASLSFGLGLPRGAPRGNVLGNELVGDRGQPHTTKGARQAKQEAVGLLKALRLDGGNQLGGVNVRRYHRQLKGLEQLVLCASARAVEGATPATRRLIALAKASPYMID